MQNVNRIQCKECSANIYIDSISNAETEKKLRKIFENYMPILNLMPAKKLEKLLRFLIPVTWGYSKKDLGLVCKSRHICLLCKSAKNLGRDKWFKLQISLSGAKEWGKKNLSLKNPV